MKQVAYKLLNVVCIIELVLFAFFYGALVESRIGAPPARIYAETTDKSEIKQIARNYLSAATYSKEGLIDALCEYEHFDRTATSKVVGDLDVDWQEQAEKEVNEYLRMDGHSESSIRKHMKRDKFSDKQIDMAIEAADPDWNEQARIRAEILSDAGAANINIRSDLLSRGFTQEQADFALTK